MPVVDLATLRAQGILSPLDEIFAERVAALAGEKRAEVLLAAAIASRHVGQGHVCVDLRRLVGEPLAGEDGQPISAEWPDVEPWIEALRRSPLVSEAGSGKERERPLVLDARGRLYLQRYWDHQRRLADAIRARVLALEGDPPSVLAPSPSPASIDVEEPDWQRIAAFAAVQRRFCVVTGGPGTGKTFTVVEILAQLVERALARRERPPRIELLAPTGKAAARLQESVRDNKARLARAPEVLAAIPETASTIHRRLGSLRGSRTHFRHGPEEPLLADVVLVDEASMVDLALMARLADALHPDARLILLGDKDQLASVEAGAVLGDICDTGQSRRHSRAFAAEVALGTGEQIPVLPEAPENTGIWDCVVHLTRSYRYAAHSAVGALAAAINAGDAGRALELLHADGDVRLVSVEEQTPLAPLLPVATSEFRSYLAEDDPIVRLRALGAFRVLCALRRGPFGVETINIAIEGELARLGLIETAASADFIGRPLLITRNDYQLDLFNGDVGIVGEEGDGRRVAFFVSPQGHRRALGLSQLPPHETVFAMTVHKSQGSELDHVAIVLPAAMSPVLSRELLYTAVSRARERVTIFATADVLRAAIARRVERASGLRDLLWRTGSGTGG